MAPALPSKTSAMEPLSPRDPSSAAKRPLTGPEALPPSSRDVPPERNTPPPAARSAERRTRKEPSSAAKVESTSTTALPAKNREAPPEGNTRRRRRRRTPPPPETSGAMDPPAKRKTGQFERTWPPRDEVRVLKALAAHRRAHRGGLPTAAELFDALDGRLEKQGVGARELNSKQRKLKRRYDRDAEKSTPPSDEHERRLYVLSRNVWGDDSAPKQPIAQPHSVKGSSQQKPRAAQDDGAGKVGELTVNHAAEAKSADGQSGKDALAPKAQTLDEMRHLYPYLVDEAVVLVDPAVLERVVPCIDDDEAQALDKKIKKAREQLTNVVMKSAGINNMEMPTVFMFSSTKLQQEKLQHENDNNLLFDHLGKTDDVDICTQQRLARAEHEIAELRQVLIASQSQANIDRVPRHDNLSLKGRRCESAESGLQSIVAENQGPYIMVQKKVEVPHGLAHEKNVEATSKYRYAVPRNVPRNNLVRK